MNDRQITPFLAQPAARQRPNDSWKVLRKRRCMAANLLAGLFGLLGISLATSFEAAAAEYSSLSEANGPSLSLAPPPIVPPARSKSLPAPKRANFLGETASKAAKQMADWVATSADNRSLPFVIVDKTDAKVFVFSNDAQLRGAAPALLGLARGDNSVPGIGDRKLSSIRPEERTTPAGRFVAELGYDLVTDILWVDYDAAISLHRVITTGAKDRRLERLATPSPLDNRISYGCINVPVKFYETVMHPAFLGTDGIVYVLPETRSIAEEFPAYYDVKP